MPFAARIPHFGVKPQKASEFAASPSPLVLSDWYGTAIAGATGSD